MSYLKAAINKMDAKTVTHAVAIVLAEGHAEWTKRKAAEARAEGAEALVRQMGVAASAFDRCLSEYCDGPERDALRAVLRDPLAVRLMEGRDRD